MRIARIPIYGILNYLIVNILTRRLGLFLLFVLVASILFSARNGVLAQGNLVQDFAAPPDEAKPRVYWLSLIHI